MTQYTGRDVDDLLRSGMTFEQIGARFGTTGKAVESVRYRWRKKRGLIAASGSREISDGVAFEEAGNYASAIGTSTERIITEDELMQAAQVDLSTWQPVRLRHNKWETAGMDKHQDLTWEAGKITGWSRVNGVVPIQLFKVEVVLERIQPLPVKWPTIEPAVVRIEESAYHGASKQGAGDYVLIVPDMQVGYARQMLDNGEFILDPFHDRRAISILLQVAKEAQPRHIIFLGDNSDLPTWTTRFSRKPEHYFCTQPMIYELAWIYGQFRALCPNATISILEGNHDARMPRMITDNMIEACGLRQASRKGSYPVLSLPFLLGLDFIDAEWVGDYPNGIVFVEDCLMCEHGSLLRSAPGATASALLDEGLNVSRCFGHKHSQELVSKMIGVGPRRKLVKAFCPGTVSRTDGAVPAGHKRNNWSQGFVLGRVMHDHFMESLCTIVDGVSDVLGTEIVGRDYVEQLSDEVGYKF